MTAASLHPAAIREQLERLLSVEALQHSGTLSRFLKFVVNEALEGRAHELKEYTIALGVLGKKPDFNPQHDPIVRIHASRLRRVLGNYYAIQGKNDPIQITIPKGTYVPQISSGNTLSTALSAEAEPTLLRRRITVAVLPFSNFSEDEKTASFADGLGDHLSTELTRYSELSVISYYSCRNIRYKTTDIRDAGLLLDAAYLLTGSVYSDHQKLRIRVQLTLTETREQLWANTYETALSPANFFKIQDDIAWQVVSQTAGHYGAISRNIARQPSAKSNSDLSTYNAIFWYYHFVRDLSAEMFHQAEAVMRKAVKSDADYALGWAVLGEILVGGYFMGYKSLHEAHQLIAAVAFGKTAKRIDPACQHAYQTIALAQIFLKQHQESIRVIDEWEKIKPAEAGIMGAMGFILICCGHYQRGFQMMEESIQLNPYYQWWFNAGLSFYYLHIKEYENAYYWAEKMNMPDIAWEPVLKLAACMGLNEKERTASLQTLIEEKFPFLQEHAQGYLSAFIADEALVNLLVGAVNAKTD